MSIYPKSKKMLHGFKIRDSKQYKSSKLFESTSGEFATFHLSMACLEDAPSGMKEKERVKLCVKLEEKYGN